MFELDRTSRVGCVLLLVVAATLGSYAQSASATPPAGENTSILPAAVAKPTSPLAEPGTAFPGSLQPDLIAPAVPDSYQIGREDLLSVFVYQMPDLTRQVRVNGDGTIHLPLLPQAIQASGLTPPQLANAIAQYLQADRLANLPWVQVIVRQVVSRPIVVSGAVRAPGVIQATRPMSLLEVLSRAGGLDAGAGTQVLLTTPAASADAAATTRDISLQAILDGNSPDANPILRGGETVRVLPARFVYAVGSFEKPGAFPLHSGQPLTLLMAVAMAEGVKRPADLHHVRLLHSDDNGAQQSSQVDLARILQHKSPDLPLSAGDIVYLPSSTRGRLLEAAGGTLASAAAIAVGYSVLR